MTADTHDGVQAFLGVFADEVATLVAAKLERPDTRPLYTVQAAAERLNVGERSVWKLINAGKLAAIQLESGDHRSTGARGSVRIMPEELDRYIAAQRPR